MSTLWDKPWIILKTSHSLSDAMYVKPDDLILPTEPKNSIASSAGPR